MKKKLIIILLIIILGGISILKYSHFKKYNNTIPNDYIAVFNGGSGEITYSTYIYKIDNDQQNYGFKYINTTNTTVTDGSTEWKSTITKKGEVGFTTEVFKIAKENNAYSYVKLPNDNNIYEIEEFATMFTMY